MIRLWDIILDIGYISTKCSFVTAHTRWLLRYAVFFITFIKNIQTCAGEQSAATHGSLEETWATVAAINTIMFTVWSITAHFAGHRRGQSSSYREKRRRIEIYFTNLHNCLESTPVKLLIFNSCTYTEIQSVILVYDWIA